MLAVQRYRQLSPVTTKVVSVMVEATTALTGHRPLSDQQWLDLTHGGREGLTHLVATVAGSTRGYGAVAPGNGTWTIEVFAEASLTPDLDREVRHALVAAALDEIAGRGGGEAHWWVFDAEHDVVGASVAADLGLSPTRTLHQMRTPLPLDLSVREPATVRPFRVGEDEQDWLTVNNAAFAEHPEQGGWTIETVRQREAEPWFEPEGFLLHHRDGRLAAFCWTKIHRDETPVLGEIYVIAVHPDFHGLGLGKALTVAGLESIAARGVTHGMLYVDRDNTAAFEMYVQLGFTIHRTDRAFVGHVTRAQP